MWKADHAENTGPGGRCVPARNPLGLSVQQGVLAAAGAALLVSGIAIAGTPFPVGPTLILLGGLVLLVGVALPFVNQVQFGAPMVAAVTVTSAERRDRLRDVVENCRGLLIACAANLCPDEDSAARAVEACLSKGLGGWRGTDDTLLRTFLLCLLVHEARFEVLTHPDDAPTLDSFHRIPLAEREVLVLVDRAGLGAGTVATMLGLSESEVRSMQQSALAKVAASGIRS
jgi:DNA-directed RNA polymerase specialized sigma24 family protein